jgi:hypothetical protein
MEKKKLTPAQEKHLTELAGLKEQIDVQIRNFVSYLRAEHKAPEGEYDITVVSEGFIPRPPAPKPEETTVN